MKSIRMLLFFSTLAVHITAQARQDKPLKTEKTLIWRDEFKGSGLPDSSKWGYEVGYIRNEEKQYYTRSRLENCYIKGGKLIIRSEKEQYKGFGYTSASINTFRKAGFDGDFRIEIRAKLPQGKGIWPALWMMGTNRDEVGWPKCVELDIMEFVGHKPATIHGTFHWYETDMDQGKTHRSKGGTIKMEDIHKRYHVYGLERRGDSITVFMDDQYFFGMKAPEDAYAGSFTGPVYLLMNTAIGGAWGGPIDDSIFPQKFVIDYVRVYRLE